LSARTTRIEYRAPDPVCNPVPGLRRVLAAGLKGIEGRYKLPPSFPSTLQLTPEELLTRDRRLPGSLGEAIYEASGRLVAATLGEHVFEWFIRNKKAEWQEYIAQVTQWRSPGTCPSVTRGLARRTSSKSVKVGHPRVVVVVVKRERVAVAAVIVTVTDVQALLCRSSEGSRVVLPWCPAARGRPVVGDGVGAGHLVQKAQPRDPVGP